MAFSCVNCDGLFNSAQYSHYSRPRRQYCAHSQDDGTAGKNTNRVEGKWNHLSEFVSIRSPWLKLVGEKVRDDRGHVLDYWRVEKDNSAVILTLHRDRVILPRPSYRPGLGRVTLDFPGGRIPNDAQDPIHVVPTILQRELGVNNSDDIQSIDRLNVEGWPINSSFNNQVLFGFVVTLNPRVSLSTSKLYREASYSTQSPEDMTKLLQDIVCLQCRSVLLQWMSTSSRRD